MRLLFLQADGPRGKVRVFLENGTELTGLSSVSFSGGVNEHDVCSELLAVQSRYGAQEWDRVTLEFSRLVEPILCELIEDAPSTPARAIGGCGGTGFCNGDHDYSARLLAGGAVCVKCGARQAP